MRPRESPSSPANWIGKERRCGQSRRGFGEERDEKEDGGTHESGLSSSEGDLLLNSEEPVVLADSLGTLLKARQRDRGQLGVQEREKRGGDALQRAQRRPFPSISFQLLLRPETMNNKTHARSSSLDLTGLEGDGEISDEGVLGLSGSVRGHDSPLGRLSELSGLDRLGDGSDCEEERGREGKEKRVSFKKEQERKEGKGEKEKDEL